MMEAWNDLIRLTFGANPEDMIRNAIMTDAIYAENAADKNANRRMADAWQLIS